MSGFAGLGVGDTVFIKRNKAKALGVFEDRNSANVLVGHVRYTRYTGPAKWAKRRKP